MAGLCAGYELHGLGYDVVVMEARGRVGGRVHSRSDFVPPRVIECGAELIGRNHPLWQSYKTRFALGFSDVKEYGNSPIRFGERTLSFEQSKHLTDQMERELKQLTDLAAAIVDPFEPWLNSDASILDQLSLDDWLAKSKCSKLCRRAVAQQLTADNGVASSEQSLLGILAMIRGGGLDRYWTDTEVYRCRGGNQQLAEAFARELNRGSSPRVLLNSPVREIQRTDEKCTLTVIRDGTPEKLEVKDVVLAVPPSVWHTIDVIGDARLAELLRQAPAMGSNVKYIMALQERFWEVFASSPNLTEDGPVDLTWETTEVEKSGDFALVAFSGAGDADECRSWPADSRRSEYARALKPYPAICDRIIQEEFGSEVVGDPQTRGRETQTSICARRWVTDP